MVRSNLLIIMVVLVFCGELFGADVFAPSWRGEQGSVYAEFDTWEYGAFYPAPDNWSCVPPPGEAAVNVPEAYRRDAVYMGGYNGATEVLAVHSQGGVIIKLDNFDAAEEPILVRVQVTYLPDGGTKMMWGFDVWNFWGIGGAPPYNRGPEDLMDTFGPDGWGWMTNAYEFEVDPCDVTTLGLIFDAYDGLVDSVVVDTIYYGWGDDSNDVIEAGTNYWMTTEAEVVFGDGDMPAIEAGFFGPGSQELTGAVKMKGMAIMDSALADMVVERLDDIDLTDPCTLTDVNLVGYKLVSEEPVTVTYDDSSTRDFDVVLGLHAESPGQLCVMAADTNEGTFSFEIDASLGFAFEPVDGAPGIHKLIWVTLSSEDYPWQATDPVMRVRCADANDRDLWPCGQEPLLVHIGTGASYQKITYREPVSMDFDDSGLVDLPDFAQFADKWLKED